jgi:hypothetical protein
LTRNIPTGIPARPASSAGAVEVPRRLIGEHRQRLPDQGPGDRDPLALAPGQRSGQVPGPVGQPDLFQQPGGPPPRGPRRGAGQQRGQLHVLRRGELVHQVEGLEHEADRVPAQPGQGALAHLVDPLPGQPQLST